jgi:hypothetical protein
MLSRLINLIIISAIGGFSLISTNNAIAQPATKPPLEMKSENLADIINRAFFDQSGDTFTNISIGRQLNAIFGFGASRSFYPENQIAYDGKTLHGIFVDAFYKQVASDPIMYTQDMPNPYNTSLQQNPNYISFY